MKSPPTKASKHTYKTTSLLSGILSSPPFTPLQTPGICCISPILSHEQSSPSGAPRPGSTPTLSEMDWRLPSQACPASLCNLHFCDYGILQPSLADVAWAQVQVRTSNRDCKRTASQLISSQRSINHTIHLISSSQD